ncbi:MAG: hypothetical protein KZQ95_18590 [Candidatus Thiodiazotropha sp. (ex Epidulcina cf. delphinae)]|nr:hypothetical protein [Candidatus Thiodiazotropha sp. (ex Epidulcina cf. delphinae)]
MKGKPERKKSCNNKSVFDYNLLLKPNGSVEIYDKGGKILKSKRKTKCPPVEKILNVRTLAIVEAKGSRWTYVDPPGWWWEL